MPRSGGKTKRSKTDVTLIFSPTFPRFVLCACATCCAYRSGVMPDARVLSLDVIACCNCFILFHSVRVSPPHPRKRAQSGFRVQLVLSWGKIRRSIDVICRKVLEYLTTRAMRILQVPAHPRRQGPKAFDASRIPARFASHFPQHSWQLGVAGSFSWCVCCVGLGLWIKNLGKDWPHGLVIVPRAIGKILTCILVTTSFSRPGGGCGPVVLVAFV